MIKKLCLVAAGLLGAASAVQATVSIALDAGVLRTATGQTFTGGLLQLVAVRSSAGTFAAPTSTSFLGGDTTNELVVLSFAFNQGGTGFVTGETSNLLNFAYENTTAQFSTTTFDPGDSLLLRWYPSLTLSSTAPGAGTTYGQYRSSAAPDGGLTWFGPTDGTSYGLGAGLNFLTTTAGGSNLETAGFASNVVAVPEPSTVLLLGVGAVGTFAMLRRRAAKA